MKQVLVIGGTYFTGRMFNILASRSGEFEITVVNRGKYSLNYSHISNIKLERHDVEGLRRLPDREYDAIIDFCAYEPGDIRTFVENMACRAKQYIYVSTVSVYDISAPTPVTESAPTAKYFGTDENSVYVSKKLALEGEAAEACANKGIAVTIIRPAFIFGPFNYAPREPWYFTQIIKGKEIIIPEGITAKFNLVYVKDVAIALMGLVGNQRAYNEVFNLAAPEELTYERFVSALERVHGGPLPVKRLPLRDAAEKGVNLPFPVSFDELYDGAKVRNVIGLTYTPFETAFKETYDLFMKVNR